MDQKAKTEKTNGEHRKLPQEPEYGDNFPDYNEDDMQELYQTLNPPKVPLDLKPADQSSLSNVLDERGARYGAFMGHARLSQKLKQIFWTFRKEDGTAPMNSIAADQVEALEMIAHKAARILNGDPDYADSWTDIAGYAQLVADRLNGKTK